MGLGSDFFNWLQSSLVYIFQLMEHTVIFNAYGYVVTLWDLYTVSTTLIAFFDSVVFPILELWGLTDEGEESITDLGYDEGEDLKR